MVQPGAQRDAGTSGREASPRRDGGGSELRGMDRDIGVRELAGAAMIRRTHAGVMCFYIPGFSTCRDQARVATVKRTAALQPQCR